MYAIIRAGGNQYKAEPGSTLRVDRMGLELGKEFDIDEVLFIGGEAVAVGTPTVAKAKVRVVVTQHGRGDKILVFKKKRRKGYRKLNGFRADFTDLYVLSVTGPDGKSVKAAEKAAIIDPVKIQERKEKAKAAAEKAPKKTGEASSTTKKVAAAPKKKSAGKKKAGAKKATKKAVAKKKA